MVLHRYVILQECDHSEVLEPLSARILTADPIMHVYVLYVAAFSSSADNAFV